MPQKKKKKSAGVARQGQPAVRLSWWFLRPPMRLAISKLISHIIIRSNVVEIPILCMSRLIIIQLRVCVCFGFYRAVRQMSGVAFMSILILR